MVHRPPALAILPDRDYPKGRKFGGINHGTAKGRKTKKGKDQFKTARIL